MKRPGQEECIMRTRKQQIRTLADNQIRMMTETKNSRDRDGKRWMKTWGKGRKLQEEDENLAKRKKI